MSAAPPARFRKTKSEKWAVMAPVEALQAALEGDGVVEVQKKSGDWSKFTIASLGKPFDVDGIEMCYGYAPGDEMAAGEATPNSGAQPREAPNSAPTPAPDRDNSEPLPEFQGGDEDEWSEAF